MKAAAIYARVSSDKQKEEKTIASQTAALTEFARKCQLRFGFASDPPVTNCCSEPVL